MTAGPVSPELHVAIDEELARHDDPRLLAQALKTERAYSLELTASIGLDSMFDQVNPIWMRMVGWPVKRLYVGAVESYEPYSELATKSWAEVCRELGPPNTDPPSTGKGVLADLLLPSLKAAYGAEFRNLATVRRSESSTRLLPIATCRVVRRVGVRICRCPKQPRPIPSAASRSSSSTPMAAGSSTAWGQTASTTEEISRIKKTSAVALRNCGGRSKAARVGTSSSLRTTPTVRIRACSRSRRRQRLQNATNVLDTDKKRMYTIRHAGHASDLQHLRLLAAQRSARQRFDARPCPAYF